jgi:hypothetical protein
VSKGPDAFIRRAVAAGSKGRLSGNQSTGKQILAELMSWQLKPERHFPHWRKASALVKVTGRITLGDGLHNLGKRAAPRH